LRKSVSSLIISAFLLFLVTAVSPWCQAAEPEAAGLSPAERTWLVSNQDKLTLLFSVDFPPIEYLSPQGYFTGLGADIVAEIEQRLNIQFIKRPSKEWLPILAALESGESAVAPTIVSSPERQRYASFTVPYVTLPVVIITNRNVRGKLTLDDLAGKRVAVVGGFVTEKYVGEQSQGRFEVVPVLNVLEGLHEVAFGQVDAMVENIAVAAHYIAQENLPNLRVAGSTDLSFPLSIGVSRKYPLLLSAIDKAMAAIPAERIQQIRNQWISLEVESGMDPETLRLLRLVALFTVLLLIGLAVITFFLKRRLNQQVDRLRVTQRNLQVSEEQYRELVENAASIIVRIDAEFRVTFFNEFAQRFFGYGLEEIIGQPVIGTIVPARESSGRDLAAMLADIRQHPDAYVTNENENIRRNGERVWIAWANKPIYDEKGCLRELLCVGTDISERKRAEDRLRESEARFQAFFALSPVPFAYVSPDGRILATNERFRDLLGYAPEEIPTVEQCWQLVYPDPEYRRWVEESWQAAVRNAHKSGSVIEMQEHLVTAKDGSVCTLLINGTIVGDYLLVSFYDITERKRVEEEREHLHAQLLQAQKMESVGRLAGGVAHDFNNMLGAIVGYTELSLRMVAADDPLHKYLIQILHAAERSTHLTRQLLAFARKQTIAPKVVDLNETVEGMLKMLRRLIGEDIDLAWLADADLWPVMMDTSQIDQILANLCVNARDAIGGVGKVTIETENRVFDSAFCESHPEFFPGAFVMLAVSDDGCGMDKDTLDNIFEPFFTTKDLGEGTGLGLATIYGIVKQNNGFITVSSEPGKGSTFNIYLPRYTGKRAEERTVVEVEPLPLARGETVLLVEDEATIMELTHLILESLGYAVLTASTPESALTQAEAYQGNIDLLITDVVMPKMNGRQLAERLLAIRPLLRCLFMSGYTANVIAHRGVLDQGVDFIQKPFSMQAMAVKIRAVLAQKSPAG